MAENNLKYFLKLHILQKILKSNAIFITVVGFLIIIISATNISPSQFWLPKIQNSKKQYAIICTIFGSLIFLCGLVKIRGTWQQRSKWLLAAQAFTFILFFVAVALSVIGKIELESVFQYRKCEDVEWLKPYRDMELQARKQFCKKSCQCFLNPQDFDHTDFNILKEYSYNEDDNSLPIQYQQCLHPIFNEQQKNIVKLFKNLETEFKCSGFCDYDYIYKFTDVNRGNPKKKLACFSSLDKLYHQYGEVAMFINIGVAVILFFSILTSMCLYFHPLNRSRSILKKMDFQVNYKKTYTHYSFSGDKLLSDSQSSAQSQQM